MPFFSSQAPLDDCPRTTLWHFGMLTILATLILSQTFLAQAEECANELEGLPSEIVKQLTLQSDSGSLPSDSMITFNCQLKPSKLLLSFSEGRSTENGIYVVDPSGKTKPHKLTRGSHSQIDMVKDKSGTPYLLTRASAITHGTLWHEYRLLNLKTLNSKIIYEGEEDGESGGCHRHEFLNLKKALLQHNIQVADANADGHRDIILIAQEEDCQTLLLSTITKTFTATRKGFSSTTKITKHTVTPLAKAYRAAEDALSESKYGEAIDLLEAAQVQRLLTHSPSSIDLPIYRHIEILRTYASTLIILSRDNYAIPVLQRIIELSPTEIHTYLDLGYIYYYRFKQTKNTLDKESAVRYYRTLNELLEKGERGEFPDHAKCLLLDETKPLTKTEQENLDQTKTYLKCTSPLSSLTEEEKMGDEKRV